MSCDTTIPEKLNQGDIFEIVTSATGRNEGRVFIVAYPGARTPGTVDERDDAYHFVALDNGDTFSGNFRERGGPQWLVRVLRPRVERGQARFGFLRVVG